jgi:hypothetical protein
MSVVSETSRFVTITPSFGAKCGKLSLGGKAGFRVYFLVGHEASARGVEAFRINVLCRN